MCLLVPNGQDVNEAYEGWNGQQQQEDERADVRESPERVLGSFLFHALCRPWLEAGKESDENRRRYGDLMRAARWSRGPPDRDVFGLKVVGSGKSRLNLLREEIALEFSDEWGTIRGCRMASIGVSQEVEIK